MSISVSVVIPTYNRAQLLLVAISSVLAQSCPPQEIIVIDDCSNDGTAEMLERISRHMRRQGAGVGAAAVPGGGGRGMVAGVGAHGAGRGGARRATLRVLRLEVHSGYPGRVRNYGIAAATGDYIAFLDDDDQWLPRKLELQAALHASHPDCVISCSDEYWLRRGRMIAHPPPGEQTLNFAAALRKCTIGPSTAMVRRECIDPCCSEASQGFEPTLELAEDYHLWLRLLDRHQACCVPQKLTLKCEHGQPQLSNKYPYIERFRIDALRLLLEQGCLSTPHHQAAAAVCAEKCRLWSTGARKRGRTAEALDYERMAEYALSATR